MPPRIPPVSDQAATPAARAIFDKTARAIGTVPNLHRTLGHSEAALVAYAGMAAALATGKLSAQLRERIALFTASLNGCTYCASAHTALGKDAGLDADELARNLDGESDDPASATVLAFTKSLIERRGDVPDAELEAVRRAGFGDAEVVEIAANVALNLFTNSFNRLARTDVDFPRVELLGVA